MALPYVCARCCRKEARNLAVVNLGRRERQRYTSSAHAYDQEPRYTGLPHESSPGRTQSQSQAPQNAGPSDTRPKPRYKQPEELLSYLSPSRKPRTNLGRYSRTPLQVLASQDNGKEHDDTLELNSQLPYNQLKEHLAQDELEEAWSYFLQNFSPRSFTAMMRPSLTEVVHPDRSDAFEDLAHKLVLAWMTPLTGSQRPFVLPSPLEVVNYFRQYKVMNPAIHKKVVWRMLTKLQEARSKSVAGFKDPLAIQAFEQVLVLWREWVQASNRASSPGRSSPSPSPAGAANSESSDGSWALLPDNVSLKEPRPGHSPRSFTDCITQSVPGFRAWDKFGGPNAAASALFIYDLLTVGIHDDATLSERFAKYAPLSADIHRILSSTALQRPFRVWMRERLLSCDVRDRYATDLVVRLWKVSKSPPVENEEPFGEDDRPTPETMVETIITKLGRAYKTQNLDWAEKLWSNCQRFLLSEEVKTASELDIIKVYEHFMLTFLSLRRTDSALHVWNTMIKNGQQPTTATWTVMMKGCHYSKDPISMESMWQRMRNSGTQPDLQAWSTRIFGLLRFGRIDDGLRALDEMGRNWDQSQRQSQKKAQAQKKKNQSMPDKGSDDEPIDVPKPDTAILNTAISALASQNKQYLGTVLQWSRQFDIELDLITYNLLINVSLAQGATSEALNLFHRMTTSGIEPDSSTLTILLTSLFHSSTLRSLSPEDQESRILDFITSLENEGIPIDTRGYALVIDRLMKELQNAPAAYRILNIMAKKGIEPTAHIYTILMTHYFQSDPPNLSAVDALWSRIQSLPNYSEKVDTIFYDRMVEGYARHGDVGRMMVFFTRMSKEGKRPGWLAVRAVVECLARAGQWDRVREVVVDVRRGEGLLRTGLRGRTGQKEFWALVTELGVEV